MLGDEPITRAYDRNAGYWISMIRSGADPYQTQITDPALLDSIGQVIGLHILDAGCGEGYLARKLVDLGAAGVTGVDTCRAFIDAAVGARTPRCQFVHADVAHLPLPDDNMDLVVANRLPHGLTDPGLRYHEFARVLRHGGRLVIVGQHPCFYGVGAERSPDADDVTVDSYFDSRIVRQHLDVADKISPVPSVQKLYSLEQYIGMLTTAGFVIVGLREPRPTTGQYRADPLWRTRFQRPLFLLIEAELR